MISFFWDSIVESIGEDGLPIYDRACSAQDLRDLFGKFFTDGVYIGDPNAFHVTAGTGMTVNVKQGFGAVKNTCCLEVNERTLELTAAGDNPRIDTVVLRWNSNIEARKVDLYVHQGSTAAKPVRPNLTRTESVYELGIADIYIPANTTSVSNDRITDTRLENARCGIMSPFMEIDTTTFYSQLEAALEKQTGELQQQTDRAVELAQSALDGTTAGNLQSQIDELEENLDSSIASVIEDSKNIMKQLSDDVIVESVNNAFVNVPQWIERGTGYAAAKIWVINDYDGEYYQQLGTMYNFVFPDTSDDPFEYRLVQQFWYADSVCMRYTIPIYDDADGKWKLGFSVDTISSVPAPGSITEDMLSSGLKSNIKEIATGTAQVNIGTSYTKTAINFGRQFSSTPNVIVSVHTDGGADSVFVSAVGITKTGFSVSAKKTTGNTSAYGVSWVAIA